MNKYSLQFRDKSVEESFLKETADNIQVKTFKFVSACYSLYFIFSLSLCVYNYDLTKIITRIISINILLSCLFIVNKQNKVVDVGLMILNLLITVFEWERDDSYDKYNYYLYGNNSMLIHSFLLITQNFRSAIVTNFLLLIIRLGITGLYTEIIYVQLVIAIITSVVLVFRLYLSEKLSRDLFLLTLRDNSWEIMLPLILTKPFLMFSLDEGNFSNSLKMMNKLNFPFEEVNTVNEFLGEAYLGKKSLKEYIYNYVLQKKMKQPFVEELISLLLSGCYLAQPNFFLVLESEDRYNQMIESKLKILHFKYLFFFKNHIRKTCKMLRTCLIYKSTSLLVNLLISHRESLIFYDNSQAQLNLVNVSKLLNRMVKYFQGLNYQIKFKKTAKVEVLTIKCYLLGFLYEIFKSLDRSKNYQIKLISFENTQSIYLKGLNQLPTTSLYEFCECSLMSRQVLDDQSINDGSQKAFVFVFLKNPINSYYKRPSNLSIQFFGSL